MSPASTTQPTTTAHLSADQALHLAQVDAQGAYGDLSEYRIVIALRQGAWYIDYELMEPMTAGGGPHYVIDRVTGRIVSKRYEQ